MHYLIFLGIVLIILSIIVWVISFYSSNKISSINTLYILFTIILFITGIYFLFKGAIINTKEEVLKHLVIQNIVELRLNESNDSVEYYIRPGVDSTWNSLISYLNKK